MSIYDALLVPTDLFARGGGGGSGGGSGDGGGIIMFLGYLPAHFFGTYIRKHLHNPLGAGIAIGGSIAYGMLWWFFGSFGFLVSLGAFLGGPAGYFGWFSKAFQQLKRHKVAKQQMAIAANQDAAWNEQALNDYVQQVFLAFQTDWSSFNTTRMKSYLTPTFGYHMELILCALQLRQRRNEVAEPKILDCYAVEVIDSESNDQDQITYYIRATANDKLIERIDGQESLLFTDANEFHEHWRFKRSGSTWLLDGIEQLTANQAMARPQVRAFAAQYGLNYSTDWGWLLLARRGQLFGAAKFGTSDINNHVIGVHNNLLIELYTYLPQTDSSKTNTDQYLIAQVALPKRYDSIIVEAKTSIIGSIFKRTPSGYNKISMEWPDFNKRYNVYATNVEQVTAFELLHPAFMQKLFALQFSVSIEVVDNVVYLYTKDKKADYITMYAILQESFKEMRL